MITIHCTQKVQKRLKLTFSTEIPETKSYLGNWYCNEFTCNRSKYLLFTNESTLLSIIIAIKDAKSIDGYLNLFCQRYFKTMLNWDIPQIIIEHELNQTNDFTFAKTQSRSVIGSMNDIITCATYHATAINTTPDSHQTAAQLNRMPMGAIKSNPQNATLNTFLNNYPIPQE